ncbi:MAG TPA: hypothetical protein VHD62_18775 [Opitutaceae bacterium]|nr:hypothetical protein [Opitutaceae bacterium]
MSVSKSRPLLALARAPQGLPRVSGVNLRAGLPIASNRAFIRAWAARRAKLLAAAAAKSRAK